VPKDEEKEKRKRKEDKQNITHGWDFFSPSSFALYICTI
jgi:hypothetical protein